MTKRYVLEIYEPSSRTSVAESIESDSPFGAVAKGDYFNSETSSSLGNAAPDKARASTPFSLASRRSLRPIENVVVDGTVAASQFARIQADRRDVTSSL